MISQHNSSLSLIHHDDSIFRTTQNDDRLQRAIKLLKTITQQNDQLEDKIQTLRSDPIQFINPIKNQLKIQIKQLKDQNSKLKNLLEESKLPAYSEMKRKSFMPNQNNDRSERDSMKSSMRQSLRNSLTGRPALSQINSNSNYDKNQNVSTCYNEEQRLRQSTQMVNPILKLQKPSQNEQIERERITNEIHYLIAKTQIFESTIEEMKAKEDKECQKNIVKLEQSEPQLAKIQEYKKKLLRLLNKLKSREIEMDEMVKMYKQLHEQTIKKLKESTEALRLLQEQKIDEDVEAKYAQVLELEQRLQIINAELEQMDEQKWLQKVFKQLTVVFRRLGIPIPKCESARLGIDELCEILIEHHLMYKQDYADKLSKLKEYSEEEKSNNQRMLNNLKAKQQALSKKLNTLQMQKGSNTKK